MTTKTFAKPNFSGMIAWALDKRTNGTEADKLKHALEEAWDAGRNELRYELGPLLCRVQHERDHDPSDACDGPLQYAAELDGKVYCSCAKHFPDVVANPRVQLVRFP